LLGAFLGDALEVLLGFVAQAVFQRFTLIWIRFVIVLTGLGRLDDAVARDGGLHHHFGRAGINRDLNAFLSAMPLAVGLLLKTAAGEFIGQDLAELFSRHHSEQFQLRRDAVAGFDDAPQRFTDA
jgi:hypothetical protein